MGSGSVVVLDTNILVSAFGWEGPERRLYRLARDGPLRAATSPELLADPAGTDGRMITLGHPAVVARLPVEGGEQPAGGGRDDDPPTTRSGLPAWVTARR